MSWILVDKFDPWGALLADRHYPRQSVGSPQFMSPGRTIVMVTPRRDAVWGVVFNVFREVWRWRNSIFRNESGRRSSDLIIEATRLTYEKWKERYGDLPTAPLTTEVDINATRSRRSRRHLPGHCYRVAGWRELEQLPAGHGRPAKVRLVAPMQLRLAV
jgi:hypothetical protein